MELGNTARNAGELDGSVRTMNILLGKLNVNVVLECLVPAIRCIFSNLKTRRNPYDAS